MDPYRAALLAKAKEKAASATDTNTETNATSETTEAQQNATEPTNTQLQPQTQQHSQQQELQIQPTAPRKPPPGPVRMRVGKWERIWDGYYSAYYFHNKKSGESTWEQPKEWPRELTIGYDASKDEFRDDNPVIKYIKVPMEAFQKQFLSRPARKQAKKEDIKKYHFEGSEGYNIWYDRYQGDMYQKKYDKQVELAETRCVMKTDCGYTKADKLDPTGARLFFCHHFAKGRCTAGHECGFFHRIPTEEDVLRFDETYDCFGRGRHGHHRSDMGGVGAIASDCCTLYVGGVNCHDGAEELLWKAFGEWGTPVKINLVRRLSVAFVQYHNRLNAEFAKAAMSGQPLENKEVLNIRWAYEDPNPQVRVERTLLSRTKLLEMAEKKGMLDEGPNSKRIRMAPYEGQAVGYYPSGDVGLLSTTGQQAIESGDGNKGEQGEPVA